MNDALFAQVIQRLAQLLGLRGVTQHHAAQNFRRKIGQAGKAHVVALGQSVAHAQGAVVGNADDITGFRAVGNLPILREKQDRRMNRNGLAKPRRRQLHAAFEGAGAQSHERDAVTVLRIHIGLHLENEARDFFFGRVNIAL